MITLGFVFTPGPQTARHSITIADSELEMPYKREWSVSLERVAPWNSAVRLTYTGNVGVGFIRYRLDNLPVPPYEGGPYVVAADALCAGTGTSPALAVNATCPVAVPIAPNEINTATDAQYQKMRATFAPYIAPTIWWPAESISSFWFMVAVKTPEIPSPSMVPFIFQFIVTRVTSPADLRFPMKEKFACRE